MAKIQRLSAFLLISLLCTQASAGVTVTHAAPEIQYKTFDPAKPPADLPHLEAGEAAVTGSMFDFQLVPRYELVSRGKADDGSSTALVSVLGVTVKLRLQVVIWLPQGAKEKLKAHEEGHRKLAEQIYTQRATEAARIAAKGMDGHRFTGQGPDVNKAIANALQTIFNDVARTYLAQTAGISNDINNIYDQITAHGTNAVPEEQAMQQAFDQYEKAHPTTKPATRPAGGK